MRVSASLRSLFLKAAFAGLFVAVPGCGNPEADKLVQEHKQMLEGTIDIHEKMLRQLESTMSAPPKGKEQLAFQMADQKSLIAELGTYSNKAMELMVRVEALPPSRRDAVKSRLTTELQPLQDKLKGVQEKMNNLTEKMRERAAKGAENKS